MNCSKVNILQQYAVTTFGSPLPETGRMTMEGTDRRQATDTEGKGLTLQAWQGLLPPP